MANINHVITLGIGTPASVSFFLRYGLGPGYTGTLGGTLHERGLAGSLAARDLAGSLYARDLAGSLANRDIAATLHERDRDGSARSRP